MSLRHLFGAMRSPHDQAVLSAKVSPLNPKQWSLSLACGHEAWVTSSRKPARKTQWCERCAAASLPVEGGER